MSWVQGKDCADAEPDPLLPFSIYIIDHMNEDHEDAMIIICQKMSKAVDTSSVTMTGIDRYGFEMSAMIKYFSVHFQTLSNHFRNSSS